MATNSKKEVPSFEEMSRLYQNWLAHDKTGTQADFFKKHGWTRTKFFDEEYYRANPEERPK